VVDVTRVAFVCDRLDAGDEFIYTENLARGLLASGGTALCLVAPGGELSARLGEAGVALALFSRLCGRLLGRLAASRAAAGLRGFEARVVHAQSLAAYRPARRIARKLELPVVVTAHDFVARPGDLPWRQDRAPLVIAVSEPLRENLVNDGAVPKARVIVTPVGIDSSLYAARTPPPGAAVPASPPAGDPAGPSEEAGAGPQAGVPPRGRNGPTPVVGCIAPLVERKGVEHFLRAAKRIVEAGVEAEFVVGGSGPLERALRGLARELGVRGRVTFLGGEVPPEKLLANLDCFVLPAVREALGPAALQAMAASVPVVAAGTGGVFSVVREGETGLLVPPRDDRALADAIVRLLKDRELRVELGRAGREAVEAGFALGPMVRATEEVYRRALAEHAG
jgi:glycosyltransferase involved in cell wall biosynthesis